MKLTTSYLLAFVLILTGCSNEIGLEEEPHQTNEVPVPILVMPKKIEATTKVSVDAFTNENIQDIGIYGISNTIPLYKGIYPNQIDKNQQLLFIDNPLVYPVDNSSVSLSGYYPRKSNTGDSYLINNGLLSFTLTGNEDLMYALTTDAGNKKAPKPVDLQFVHKLTNIKFKLINGLGVLNSGKIAITVIAPNSGTMDLANGAITANLSTEKFILSTDIEASSLLFQADTTVKEELLLMPFEVTKQHYTFQLNIGTQTYDIQIDSTNKPEWKEGVSYLLAITIKGLNNPIVTKSDNPNENLSGTFIHGIITKQ